MRGPHSRKYGLLGCKTPSFRKQEVHISRWQEQEHGVSRREADAIATEQTPPVISACQGFMIQLSIKPGFNIDEYLSVAAKYLPR